MATNLVRETESMSRFKSYFTYSLYIIVHLIECYSLLSARFFSSFFFSIIFSAARFLFVADDAVLFFKVLVQLDSDFDFADIAYISVIIRACFEYSL